MRFLITAGPTREYLDTVRFLTNASSGKMGYACAAAAARRGHSVVLVSGPVDLARPKGVKLIKVISAVDMATEVKKHFARCDCVIMTAAVCDYRPEKRTNFKLRKSIGKMKLPLQRTEDILASLGRTKNNQILIGFAVQDRAARQNAERKLKEKNLDAVVLNSPTAFGANKINAQILRRSARWVSFTGISKTSLATALVRLAEDLYK